MVSWAPLGKHSDALEPTWLSVEGNVHVGDASAHMTAALLLAEKATEWSDKVWCLEVDLSDAFGPSATEA